MLMTNSCPAIAGQHTDIKMFENLGLFENSKQCFSFDLVLSFELGSEVKLVIVQQINSSIHE